MRVKKRSITALILALALVFTFMPLQASAASAVTVGTPQQLANAISNAADGTVINVSNDMTYDTNTYGSFNITNNVTIDFKGHSIEISGTLFNVETGGTLNIMNAYVTGSYDLVYENEGEVSISNTTFYGHDVVYYNLGKCTFDNVTAYLTDAFMSYNYKDAVFNNCVVESENYAFPVEDQYDEEYDEYGIPSTIINGGSFTGDYLNCCMYGYCEINGGAVFVSNDEFEIYSEDIPANVIINDADFTTNGDSVFYVGSDTETNLYIYGGTFRATGSSENAIYAYYDYANVYLMGGTFISSDDSTPAFYDGYDCASFNIPYGYVAIPENWQESSEVTIVPPLYRYAGSDRYQTSLKAAYAYKEALGKEKFNTVILACGSKYADALAGSYLASIKQAPILLVNDKASTISAIQSFINENLYSGGNIYMLGGPGVVPDSAVQGLSGYNIKRLAGDDRYATNVAILEEAGIYGDEVLVCSGTGFADSLSASATGLPILLVKTSIQNSQKDFVETLGGKSFYIIGGTGAVNASLESYFSSIGYVDRIGGANRYETSVNVAKEFFDPEYADKAVLAYGSNFPDGLCGGPLANAMYGPLLLTGNGRTDRAAEYAKEANIRCGVVLGGPSLISDDSVRTIFRLAPSIQVLEK